MKSRYDWTASVAQANLEASLRFIDPETAARSELLAHDLIAHETRWTQVLSLPSLKNTPLRRAWPGADAIGRGPAPGYRIHTLTPRGGPP